MSRPEAIAAARQELASLRDLFHHNAERCARIDAILAVLRA